MKKIMKIFVVVVLLSSLCFLASCSGKSLNAKKVSKIELGDSKTAVEDVLGTPYEFEQGATYYEYYSKNYIDLAKKIEENANKLLEANSEKELEDIFKKDEEYTKQAETMEYKYVRITFRDNVVSEILLDAKKIGESSSKKNPKKTNIFKCEIPQFVKTGEITFETYFDDGSYFKGTSYAFVDDGEDVSKVDNEVEIHWGDTFVDRYNGTTKIVENKTGINNDLFYMNFSKSELTIKKDFDSNSFDSLNLTEEIRSTIQSIVIDKVVYKFSESFFSSFESLNNVYYEGTIEDWCKMISFGSSTPMDYASHFYIRNSNNEWEEVTNIEIPHPIPQICKYQFCGFSNVTSITIPDSVRIIGYNAFYKCSSLTSVTIGNRVTSIGSYAFSGCSNLTSVYYKGSPEDWDNILISVNNSPLTSATRYYYSETEPTESGNYWHYVNGLPTKW